MTLAHNYRSRLVPNALCGLLTIQPCMVKYQPHCLPRALRKTLLPSILLLNRLNSSNLTRISAALVNECPTLNDWPACLAAIVVVTLFPVLSRGLNSYFILPESVLRTTNSSLPPSLHTYIIESGVNAWQDARFRAPLHLLREGAENQKTYRGKTEAYVCVSRLPSHVMFFEIMRKT
jgi:hypothetical protein